MTLVYLVIGWIAGIALTTWNLRLGPAWPIFTVGGLIVALAMRRNVQMRQIGLLIMMAGLGMWRYSSAQPTFTSADLAYYNDKGFAQMVGIVSDAPDVRDNNVHLTVDMQSLRVNNQEIPVHGSALVIGDRFGDYAYGDKLQIKGTPATAPNFDTFSYHDYLARTGVYSFIPYSQITILEHGQGSSITAGMLDIRERAHQLISRLLPSPQSALLTGILLGVDNDISPEISNAFSQTGTSHIIAISGSNITIVAGLLLAVFGHLTDKRIAAIMMLLGIAVYTIFVGASPSVVRAAIMAALAILAQRFGRRSDGLTALALSVFVMTFLNPNLLLDMGLVLSATATLGLILYTEPLTKFSESVAKRLFAAETAQRVVEIFADAVLITIAAQITTLPIIFLVFGQFSLVSFFVNVLVVPAQGSIMSLGILAVIIGAIWLPAGQVVAWLVGIPVAYTLAIIRAAAQLPGASVPVSPDPILIVGYYLVLFGMTAVLSQPPETRRTWFTRVRRAATTPTVAALGLATAALIWAIALSRPDGKLHVWFLSVGAGNAVLIQSPQGAHILVDGGENPTQLRTALGDRLPFNQRDLDLLIVTQPKPTTISALPPLFDRYTVQSAITNGMTSTDDSYKALTDAFSSAKTQIAIATAGYQVQTNDGLDLEIVFPDKVPDDPKAKPGDAPLILRLSYKGASFLLTSDLTENGVKSLLGSGKYLGATVLEIPSNGKEKENPDELIKAVSPQVAVIEAEQGNQSAQPDNSVLNRLKTLGTTNIYRTDLQGAVEIVTDGSQLWISTAQATEIIPSPTPSVG